MKIYAPKPSLTIKLLLVSTALCLVGAYFGQAKLTALACIGGSCGILSSASGINVMLHGGKAIILLVVIATLVYLLSTFILFGA